MSYYLPKLGELHPSARKARILRVFCFLEACFLAGLFCLLETQKVKLIRESELLQNHLPVSRTTLWRMVRDGQFPGPIKLRGTTAWKEQDIQAWLDKQNPNTPTQ